MATPIRQTLVDNINTQLQTITTGNGYETNLGSNVFEWRETPLQQSELPGIIFRDPSNQQSKTFGKHESTLRLEIEVYTQGLPAIMRKAIADVIKCIGVEGLKANPFTVAEVVKFSGDEEIDASHTEHRFSGVKMTFEIEYLTDPWNPFTNT